MGRACELVATTVTAAAVTPGPSVEAPVMPCMCAVIAMVVVMVMAVVSRDVET